MQSSVVSQRQPNLNTSSWLITLQLCIKSLINIEQGAHGGRYGITIWCSRRLCMCDSTSDVPGHVFTSSSTPDTIRPRSSVCMKDVDLRSGRLWMSVALRDHCACSGCTDGCNGHPTEVISKLYHTMLLGRDALLQTR